MINCSCFVKNMQNLYSSLCLKLVCLSRSICYPSLCFFRFILLRATPFWIELCYFVLLSFLGFGFLKALKPRTHSFRPRNLDLFFTSVSAATVSSMSTVEMEVFSNSQLIIITFLMFLGGEVFTSMAGLLLRQFKLKLEVILHRNGEKVASVLSNPSSSPDENAIDIDKMEQGLIVKLHHDQHHVFDSQDLITLYHSSIRLLGFVVLGYLLVVNVLGSALVLGYVSLVSSNAREVLKTKGLKLSTFSVFTSVSTFASCGFVPTNENMMVFAKNSGLLLILIPQVLLGNTLFPSCLRFSIWVMAKFFEKSGAEFMYLLKNSKEIGYLHLLPKRHSKWLVVTVLGFIVVQVMMFGSMEWKSEGLEGLNPWQKLVGIVFQSVNTRHTGETFMDISIISPAILVFIVVMMLVSSPYSNSISLSLLFSLLTCMHFACYIKSSPIF